MALTKYRDLTRRLLDSAGLQLNGPNPWDIQIHDNRFYPWCCLDPRVQPHLPVNPAARGGNDLSASRVPYGTPKANRERGECG